METPAYFAPNYFEPGQSVVYGEFNATVVRHFGVDVLDPEWFVCHEAVYYPSLDALHAVGVAIKPVG